MAKIVLFADGTGNARTAQFRTNVWKLYSALDSTPGSGQVAYYHDGVGTSSFAPLRLLGGVFGIGLARNVQALYAFVCRNLASDTDEIHLFGFSRGAFTVRLLSGLIHHEGVRHIQDEALLARWVKRAYRRNRMRIILRQVHGPRRWFFQLWARIYGGRQENDDDEAMLAARLAPGEAVPPLLRPRIRFMGVWDTVSAYGGPIVEMVRGFDKWVVPLSMPDYKLSPSVDVARHAMSLDEEREAFLPLPWDECASERRERLRQVWFAGVHSDVGGGYADEGLSGVALLWMMEEARLHGRLAFLPEAEPPLRVAANPWGPMHDSRSGVGLAYRYQPRSINALMGLTRNSPLRDPASGTARMLDKVVVHDSVLCRIRDPDGYAPIVLPTEFDASDGRHVTLPAGYRDRIWTLVGRRRRMQRLLLLTLIAMLFAPLYPEASLFIDQGLAAPLGIALGLVPVVPAWAKAAYAGAGSYLVLGGLLVYLLYRGGIRQRREITKVAAQMWAGRVERPAAAVAALSARPSYSDRWLAIRRWSLRALRWQVLPAAFGLSFYLLVGFAAWLAALQATQIVRETQGRVCPRGMVPGLRFRTSEPCHALGFEVHAHQRYRVRLVVTANWVDGSVVTSPAGFTYAESVGQRVRALDTAGALRNWAAHLGGIAMRREVTARWFRPVLAIREPGSRWLFKQVLAPQPGADGAWYAHVVAPVSGTTFLYVNDAMLPWAHQAAFYRSNRGAAQVEIEPEY